VLDRLRARQKALCARMRRPVSLQAVLWTYIGLFLAIGFTVQTGSEADQAIRDESRARAAAVRMVSDERTKDLCGVVVNVHTNAKFRATTERHRVQNIRSYLRSPDPSSPELTARIRDTLPLARADYRQARANVRATKPPPTCQLYIKEKK
jgi:hypothetical protein